MSNDYDAYSYYAYAPSKVRKPNASRASQVVEGFDGALLTYDSEGMLRRIERTKTRQDVRRKDGSWTIIYQAILPAVEEWGEDGRFISAAYAPEDQSDVHVLMKFMGDKLARGGGVNEDFVVPYMGSFIPATGFQKWRGEAYEGIQQTLAECMAYGKHSPFRKSWRPFDRRTLPEEGQEVRKWKSGPEDNEGEQERKPEPAAPVDEDPFACIDLKQIKRQEPKRKRPGCWEYHEEQNRAPWSSLDDTQIRRHRVEANTARRARIRRWAAQRGIVLRKSARYPKDLLGAYVHENPTDGEITAERMLDAHLACCPECRADGIMGEEVAIVPPHNYEYRALHRRRCPDCLAGRPCELK